jgi:phosphoribosylanthranilate isomerase
VPLLKICGLCEPAQAAAVAALGVDAIGVIGVPGSPRFVPASRRAALFEAVAAARPACRRVLVVADPGDHELEELQVAGGHQVVQLHGGESAERCRELRDRLDAQLWKALRIRSPLDLEAAPAYTEGVEALLLDAWVPDALGGTGHRIPIEWLTSFSPAVPWWLAGGITPERVADVLRHVQPHGLDASRGVEAAPGHKNLRRVEALVAAVRSGAAAGAAA